jgi:hypothetical protein
MIKLIVIIFLGYLVFKIIKNGAYLALENLFGSKKLDPPEELIQCAHCERFISKKIALKYQKLDFCSQDCIDQFKASER